jgi:hypothetical protein
MVQGPYFLGLEVFGQSLVLDCIAAGGEDLRTYEVPGQGQYGSEIQDLCARAVRTSSFYGELQRLLDAHLAIVPRLLSCGQRQPPPEVKNALAVGIAHPFGLSPRFEGWLVGRIQRTMEDVGISPSVYEVDYATCSVVSLIGRKQIAPGSWVVLGPLASSKNGICVDVDEIKTSECRYRIRQRPRNLQETGTAGQVVIGAGSHTEQGNNFEVCVGRDELAKGAALYACSLKCMSAVDIVQRVFPGELWLFGRGRSSGAYWRRLFGAYEPIEREGTATHIEYQGELPTNLKIGYRFPPEPYFTDWVEDNENALMEHSWTVKVPDSVRKSSSEGRDKRLEFRLRWAVDLRQDKRLTVTG